MSFVSHTQDDREKMLSAIGVDTVDELFRSIPSDLRSPSLDLPPGRSEMEVTKVLSNLANRNYTHLVNFVGGGFYDHYIPAAVDALASRSEFATSYTPYQAEASQGILQGIYEFQSSICRLTEMEVANASLYDGGTALYEAAMMAIRITGKSKIIMDGGVSPIYRKMMYSYTSNLRIQFVESADTHGHSDRDEIAHHLDDETAAVILQNPNFFGVIDDHSDIAEMCHAKGALIIESVYPVSLGLLKTPREMNVDITTGEGQSLGIPLSFGGPFLGFMATREKFTRKMPGRIAGATVDAQGRRGFVLTLQTREQHIRREKAMSNICTNQTLCALRALIFMSLYGESGMADLAQLCLDKSEYTKDKLSQVRGVEIMRTSPTFNEFTVRLPQDPNIVIGKMIDRGFAAGFPLGRYYQDMADYLLVAVTEKRTKQEIGMFAETLEDVLWN